MIQGEVLNFQNQILSYHELFHDKVKIKEKISVGCQWAVMDLLRLNNVEFSFHKYANDHCLWTLWILTICCVSFFVLILSIWLAIDPNNLTNHILEFSKNLIQTSLILLIHFTKWIKLNVNNKDTTTTPVMLFWCFTCFEHSNFKYILHTLFYCFYFWLWIGSCTLDLIAIVSK